MATFACSSSPPPAKSDDSDVELPDDEPPPSEPPPVEPPPLDFDASPGFDNDAGALCTGSVPTTPESEPNNTADSANTLPWVFDQTHSLCGRVTSADPVDHFTYTMTSTTSWSYGMAQPGSVGDGQVQILCTNQTNGATFDVTTGPYPNVLGTVNCTATLTSGTTADWRVTLRVCTGNIACPAPQN